MRASQDQFLGPNVALKGFFELLEPDRSTGIVALRYLFNDAFFERREVCVEGTADGSLDASFHILLESVEHVSGYKIS